MPQRPCRSSAVVVIVADGVVVVTRAHSQSQSQSQSLESQSQSQSRSQSQNQPDLSLPTWKPGDREESESFKGLTAWQPMRLRRPRGMHTQEKSGLEPGFLTPPVLTPQLEPP